jgi:GrpB-like predicted nucleotidyltransferase (UPF0157 family)
MKEAPVELVPHDPRWAELFAVERDAIAQRLGEWLVGSPVHIGSTAVRGLVAKPIVDIMAPVASLEASRPAIDAATAMGYHYFPYKPEVMHWFCKPSLSARTHHLHLVPADSRSWLDRLRFRDALRQDERVRTAYAALKLALAAAHREDREAYTEAKGPFIESVLRRTRGTDGAA